VTPSASVGCAGTLRGGCSASSGTGTPSAGSPGCGARRFTQAHHITWWESGGRTDLDNLVLICFFHHKLVHEHRWVIRRDPDGTVRWFHPDGTRYRAGPAPPGESVEQQLALAGAG
jgi:hypothetical protein